MVRSNVILCGPQRLSPSIEGAVRSLRIKGKVALITAGWEERESEDSELTEHLGLPAINLGIYQRVEDIFLEDPDLLTAMRDRHDLMRRMQELYRLRLAHLLECARELMQRMEEDLSELDRELLEIETKAAIESVRRLDNHHLQQLEKVHEEFDASLSPQDRPAVARHRKELKKVLKDCGCIAIAGGHVAILLNRMRLLDILSLAKNMPVIAWSAGAMALSQRIVLFHDSPPQGAGNAEVLESGLGFIQGVVPLPHAARRLRLNDTARVGLFAQRFGPDACVAMDQGARIDWNGSKWSAQPGTRRLKADGSLVEMN